MKELDDITGAIVDAAMKIHMGLGPGLLESVYEAVLARDLARRGFQVERQKVIRFEYDGMVFEEGLHRIVNNLPPSASPRLRVNRLPGDPHA
jgi:iron complex transport system substrate-binding protein